MIKKLLALSLFAVIAVNAFGAEYTATWIGNGEYPGWVESTNWSTDTYPNNMDGNIYDVLINQDAEIRFTDHDEVTIRNITLENAEVDFNLSICFGYAVKPFTFNTMTINPESEVDLDGCVLDGSIINNSNLDFSGSELTGAITNESKMWFCGGEIEGQLINNEKLIIEKDSEVDGGFENNDLTVLMQGKTLEIEDGFFVNNSSIRLYNASIIISGINATPINKGLIAGTGSIFTDMLFDNTGTIASVGGFLTVHSEIIFNNGGAMAQESSEKTLKAEMGSTLIIEQGANTLENNGKIIIEPSAAFIAKQGMFLDNQNTTASIINNSQIYMLDGSISADMITLKENSVFIGFGKIYGDFRVEAGSTAQITGPTTIVGEIEVLPGATLEIKNGQTIVLEDIVNNGTIRLVGGNIVSPGGIAGEGEVVYVDSTTSSTFDSNKDGAVNMLDLQSFVTSWLWSANWNTEAQ